MKRVYSLLLLVILFAACDQGKKSAEADLDHSKAQVDKAALEKEDPAGVYGAEFQMTEYININQILESPADYEGKRVLVTGTITSVCPMMGCWVDIKDESGNEIRVKVEDGVIVFPLSSKDHQAAIEGTVEKIELSHKKALARMAHLAKEKGQPFDSTSVTGPMTIWRIKGSGAKIEG